MEPQHPAERDTARQAPCPGHPNTGGRSLALLPGGRGGESGRSAGEDTSAPRLSARVRADAGFLAQLLAVRAHAPSQRAKCRAAPEVGAAAYETGLGLLAGAPRRVRAIEA